jgi:outer membrane protein TolC
LDAFSEVEIALAAESFLAAEETALAGAAEEARAAARLAEDRYLAGVGDYLQLLESQRQSFATESRLLAVRARRLTNRVDLHLALGGDLDAAPETALASEPPADDSAMTPDPTPEESSR